MKNKYRINENRCRTVVASQCILHNGPKIWNDIDAKLYIHDITNSIGNLVTVQCLMNRLKQLFLRGLW